MNIFMHIYIYIYHVVYLFGASLGPGQDALELASSMQTIRSLAADSAPRVHGLPLSPLGCSWDLANRLRN